LKPEKTKLNFQNLNLLLICILPVIFLFFGIKKQSELHDKLMIQGIAIDLDYENYENKNNNNNKNYKLTVQAYDFKNPEDKNEPKVRVIESSGISISEALENLKKITGLTPLYSQNKIIIFSENLAKNGIIKIIDFFSRYYENRPSVKLRIAQNNAGDFLKIIPENNNKIIKASEIRDLVDEKSDTNILDFEKEVKTPISDACLMFLEKNPQNLIQCESTAVFNYDKLIKIMDKNDSIAIQILKNSPKPGIYVFDYNKNLISCKIETPRTKIKSKLNQENNLPEFDIFIKLNANLFESEQNFENIKSIEINIEKELNNNLKLLCEKVINESTKENCDLFKFGKILRNSNPKYFKSIEKDWKSKILPNIKYNIKIDSKISMIGMNDN
jgi:spore germination protein KC